MTFEEIKQKHILCNYILEAIAWIEDCLSQEINNSCKALVRKELDRNISNLSELRDSSFEVAVMNGANFEYLPQNDRDVIIDTLIVLIKNIIRNKLKMFVE